VRSVDPFKPINPIGNPLSDHSSDRHFAVELSVMLPRATTLSLYRSKTLLCTPSTQCMNYEDRIYADHNDLTTIAANLPESCPRSRRMPTWYRLSTHGEHLSRERQLWRSPRTQHCISQFTKGLRSSSFAPTFARSIVQVILLFC
jgi:hypothetical protein